MGTSHVHRNTPQCLEGPHTQYFSGFNVPKTSGGSSESAGSDSGGLGRGPRVCVSNQLAADVAAAGWGSQADGHREVMSSLQRTLAGSSGLHGLTEWEIKKGRKQPGMAINTVYHNLINV